VKRHRVPTYVNVGQPPQSSNHGRLGNRVSGIDGQNQDGETSKGSSSSFRREGGSDATEPGLHRDGHHEKEEEEQAVR